MGSDCCTVAQKAEPANGKGANLISRESILLSRQLPFFASLSYSSPFPPHSTLLLRSPVSLEVDGNIVLFNLMVLFPLPYLSPPDP